MKKKSMMKTVSVITALAMAISPVMAMAGEDAAGIAAEAEASVEAAAAASFSAKDYIKDVLKLTEAPKKVEDGGSGPYEIKEEEGTTGIFTLSGCTVPTKTLELVALDFAKKGTISVSVDEATKLAIGARSSGDDKTSYFQLTGPDGEPVVEKNGTTSVSGKTIVTLSFDLPSAGVYTLGYSSAVEQSDQLRVSTIEVGADAGSSSGGGSGTDAPVAADITINADFTAEKYLTFTKNSANEAAMDTSSDADCFTLTGNTSNTKGTVLYNGTTYVNGLKMEGANDKGFTGTSLSFKTTAACKMILVMYDKTKAASGYPNIKIDGTKTAFSNSFYLIYDLPAGDHTLTKQDSWNLYYLGFSAGSGLGKADSGTGGKDDGSSSSAGGSSGTVAEGAGFDAAAFITSNNPSNAESSVDIPAGTTSGIYTFDNCTFPSKSTTFIGLKKTSGVVTINAAAAGTLTISGRSETDSKTSTDKSGYFVLKDSAGAVVAESNAKTGFTGKEAASISFAIPAAGTYTFGYAESPESSGQIRIFSMALATAEGGKDDGSSSAAGKDDGSSSAAGKDDGSSSAAGKDDGSSSAAGKDDGSSSAAGKDDGSSSAAGKDDGSSSSAGKDDSSSSAADKDDSSSSSAGEGGSTNVSDNSVKTVKYTIKVNGMDADVEYPESVEYSGKKTVLSNITVGGAKPGEEITISGNKTGILFSKVKFKFIKGTSDAEAYISFKAVKGVKDAKVKSAAKELNNKMKKTALKYKVAPRNLEKASLNASAIYSTKGGKWKFSVILKGENGAKDLKLKYNAKKADKSDFSVDPAYDGKAATVKITGAGNFTGSVPVSVTVK